MTWDILIPSIAHRTDKLTLLLAELGTQRGTNENVGVRVYRDNLQRSQSFKCQALLDSSVADYVSFIEDDDWVHDDYVGWITAAQDLDPDFIGFKLRYTEDGVLQVPVVHSVNSVRNELIDIPTPEVLYRQVTHLNPIKREIAVTAQFVGDYTMDRRWSQEIYESNLIKNEVFIDEELYHYRHDSNDSIQTVPYQKMAVVPPTPAFDWVTWL